MGSALVPASLTDELVPGRGSVAMMTLRYVCGPRLDAAGTG